MASMYRAHQPKSRQKGLPAAALVLTGDPEESLAAMLTAARQLLEVPACLPACLPALPCLPCLAVDQAAIIPSSRHRLHLPPAYRYVVQELGGEGFEALLNAVPWVLRLDWERCGWVVWLLLPLLACY